MYYDQGPLDFPSRQPTYSGATFLPASTPPSIPPSMQRAMAMGFGPNQQGGRRGVSYADYYNGLTGGSAPRRKMSWQQQLQLMYPRGLGHGTGGSRTQTPTYMPFRATRGMTRGAMGGGMGGNAMLPIADGSQYVPKYNMTRPGAWPNIQADQMVPYL